MSKGLRIKQLREAKGLTQEELARLLNTKRQTISKYEKGIVTNIPSDRIEELAKILESTPEYILGWDKMMDAIEDRPEEMAERHFEMIMDEDLNDIFDDFKGLDARERKIVKDLVHSLAHTKTEA